MKITKLNRITLTLAFFPLYVLSGALASCESIVVVGAGTVGTWDTEVELANPSSESLDVQLGADRFFEHGCASPPPCPFTRVTIPPMGSVRLVAADIFHATTDGLFTMYVIPEDGVTFPTVRARVADAAAPLQAVELPAVRTSTILESNTGTLIFPSVRRTATGHSNLVLTNVDLVSSLTAEIDVRTPDGAVLAQMDLTIDPDKVVFLVDVLRTLGIDSLDDGQIAVSRTSSGGTPWGFVAAVDAVNGVFISLGRNP